MFQLLSSLYIAPCGTEICPQFRQSGRGAVAVRSVHLADLRVVPSAQRTGSRSLPPSLRLMSTPPRRIVNIPLQESLQSATAPGLQIRIVFFPPCRIPKASPFRLLNARTPDGPVLPSEKQPAASLCPGTEIRTTAGKSSRFLTAPLLDTRAAESGSDHRQDKSATPVSCRPCNIWF